ncbi:hypothetical protein [Acidovorax sp.]|uniref:hypothetical protein n=1 Tax=Acidovorax sp. TaxID=1872122 RepID=UPI003CFC8978
MNLIQRIPAVIVTAVASGCSIHTGLRLKFQTVTGRNGLLHALNNALNDGQSLEGAVLGAQRFDGMPAALYEQGAELLSRSQPW